MSKIKHVRDVHVLGQLDSVGILTKLLENRVRSKLTTSELVVIASRIVILAQIDPHQFSNVEIQLAALLIRMNIVLLVCCLQVLVYLLMNFLHVANMCCCILRALARAFDR
jgi:hypothetical protein